METQTMCDSDAATTYKNYLAAAAAFAENDAVDADASKAAIEAAMNANYGEQLDAAQDALDAAKESGDPVAIKAQEAAVAAVRDKMGDLYPAGYTRHNKAVAALGNGTITFQNVEYDPERDNDGALDDSDVPLGDGDDAVVMVSHKDDGSTKRYVLVPTDAGHSACTCHDKVLNETFAICKHEIAWVLYQLTSPFLSGVDTAVDETSTKVETDADALPTLAQ